MSQREKVNYATATNKRVFDTARFLGLIPQDCFYRSPERPETLRALSGDATVYVINPLEVKFELREGVRAMLQVSRAKVVQVQMPVRPPPTA